MMAPEDVTVRRVGDDTRTDLVDRVQQGPTDLNQTDFFGALTLAQWSALNGYDQTTRRYRRTD